MIEFTCTCGKPLRASETGRSSTITCPACGKEQAVPGPEQVTAAPPPNRLDYREDDDRTRRRRYDDEPEPFTVAGAAGTSGKAILSLVLGLFGLVFLILAGLPALIVGFMALGDIANSRGRVTGKGLAYTGITLGIVSLVLTFLSPLALLFPAFMKVREASARMQATNNMRQVGLGMQNDADVNGTFPQAYTVVPSPDGGPPQPSMSWRVAVLPYIEQQPLYSQFKRDQPWDSPANQYLQSVQVKTYEFPNDTTTSPGNTYFQVFVTAPDKSPRSMFDHPSLTPQRISWGQIPDGSSYTILIAEGSTPVKWSSPQDMTFDPDQPPPALGSHFRAGSIVGMADGSARVIPTTVNPRTLKALITRDGGEIINDPDW